MRTSACTKQGGQHNFGLLVAAESDILEGGVQKCVAVVQSAGDESMNKSCCGIFGKIFSDFSNSSNVVITRLRNGVNMLL